MAPFGQVPPEGPGGDPPPPGPTPFEQLFPQPTGQNGYEEFVLAGMALREAEKRTGFPYGRQPTLTERRAYLNEPEVRRGMALLRQGLAKPIRSPHENANFATLFPDFALLRGLARALGVEQYVLLADGKTPAAVDVLADGLRLSRSISGTFVIGALVGASIQAIVLTQIADHVAQLSVRDCRRLEVILRQFLEAPDPLLDSLEQERRTSIQAISEMLRGKFDVVEAGLFATDDDGNLEPEALEMMREVERLKADPNAISALTAQVTARINSAVDEAIAWYRDPSSVVPRAAAPPGSLADQIAATVSPLYGSVSRRFTETRIRLQMVGVHAAIRRYQWEYDRLPTNLDELRLAGLEIDPYTRKPFAYRVLTRATYELASAGPYKLDGNGNYLPGQREAIIYPKPPEPTAAQPSG